MPRQTPQPTDTAPELPWLLGKAQESGSGGSELGYSPRRAVGADKLTCAGCQGTGEVLLIPSTRGAHRELLVPPSSPALGWGWCPPWFVAHLSSGSNLKARS